MKIVECPRDAMQGIKEFIPTPEKVRYINQLLRVGFDTLDFGSFVSPKAIPQMKDTADVLNALDLSNSKTELLAIIANTRGAEDAASFDRVNYLGFPLSISETFQVRNTNKTITEALNTLVEIKDICVRKDKKLVVYVSMGFGNPYGDPYDDGMVSSFVEILLALGADVISIADTVGAATESQIRLLMTSLLPKYPGREIGLHLHASTKDSREKIVAAIESGCTRIDGALRGYGGCPMAKDDLVGNLATEEVIAFLDEIGRAPLIDRKELAKAMSVADEIFPKH